MKNWISVKESLPELHVPVFAIAWQGVESPRTGKLVADKSNTIPFVTIAERQTYGIGGDYWEDTGENSIDYIVVEYWMELLLPELPYEFQTLVDEANMGDDIPLKAWKKAAIAFEENLKQKK